MRFLADMGVSQRKRGHSTFLAIGPSAASGPWLPKKVECPPSPSKIVAAFEEAQAKGLGVVSLGSKMIDPPVVKRAQRVVRLAAAMVE